MCKKVLVVDDSAFARSILIKSLMVCGLEDMELQEAGNGEEAMEIINRVVKMTNWQIGL